MAAVAGVSLGCQRRARLSPLGYRRAMIPDGYYSQTDHNGYYDRDGHYTRLRGAGRYDRDYGPPPSPPPPAAARAAYYQQGRYEQDCHRGNAAAGTIFGALAGGLIGSAASHGNGGAVVGGAVTGWPAGQHHVARYRLRRPALSVPRLCRRG